MSPSDVIPGTTTVYSGFHWLRCCTVRDDTTRFQLPGESHLSVIIPRSVAQKSLEAYSPKTWHSSAELRASTCSHNHCILWLLGVTLGRGNNPDDFCRFEPRVLQKDELIHAYPINMVSYLHHPSSCSVIETLCISSSCPWTSDFIISDYLEAGFGFIE